jgi:hypothetical protein
MRATPRNPGLKLDHETRLMARRDPQKKPLKQRLFFVGGDPS